MSRSAFQGRLSFYVNLESVPPHAPPELAYALRMFEKKGIDAQYDTQIYCTYLARLLIAIVEQLAMFLHSREE